jgi:hypothetical protein
MISFILRTIKFTFKKKVKHEFISYMLSAMVVNRLFKRDGILRYIDQSNAGNMSPNVKMQKRLK